MDRTDKRTRKSMIEKLDPKVFKDLVGYVTKHRGVPVRTMYNEFFKRYPHLKITEKMFRDWYAKWEVKINDQVNKLINTLPAEIATEGLEMGVLLKQVDQMIVMMANMGLKAEWEQAKLTGKIDSKLVMEWMFKLSRLKVSQGYLAHKMQRENKSDELMDKLMRRSRFGVIDNSELIRMAEYESDDTGDDTPNEGTVANEEERPAQPVGMESEG